MEAYPFASEELIAETEALIGEQIADSECALLKQIVSALAARSGQTVEEALGGSPRARSEVPLLQQTLVLIATS